MDDGETIEAVYRGYKIGVNSFDPEKEMAFYKLVVVQDGEEVTKLFKSMSGKAARFFDPLADGQRVKLTRHGKGSETTYDFTTLNGAASAAVARQPGEDDEFTG